MMLDPVYGIFYIPKNALQGFLLSHLTIPGDPVQFFEPLFSDNG
jgi:hypothetical protein